MKHPGRWTLAVAVVAIIGGAALSLPPVDAPAAISKPSAAAGRKPSGAGNQLTLVHRADAVHAQPTSQDWVAQFHATGSNHFEFVTLAAQAAYAGDGAAQYFVGRALARCEETNALYGNAADADEAVAHLDYSIALLDLERQEYLNCARFRSEHPFKDLPEHPGGYPANYWQSRAVASGYPVAVVAAALDSADQYNSQVIATALATGNTEAMLLFGWTQATASKAPESDPLMAAAWVLAACGNGANCGPTNDLLPLSPCSAGIELGCTERYTAVDELTASLGSEDFEQANRLAQNIQASLQYRDPAQLKKYLP